MGEDAECGADDGWVRFFRAMIAAAASVPEDQATPETVAKAQELADYSLNENIRARVEEIVRDPAKADLLKAYYRTMCKRPGFSDDYLPAFNRDSVHVVDVSNGIDGINEAGVKVDGTDYRLDCIVFCTGFELGTSWSHQAGYEVVGRDGAVISEKWADGLMTFHGLFTVGFPNMFFMGLTQTGITINVPHMLQEQADHITFIVSHCLENGLSSVEAEPDAESNWQTVMAAIAEARRPFQESCTPGYYNAEGRVNDRRSAIGTGWYLPSTEFFRMWKDWREDGRFEGLRLSSAVRSDATEVTR
jgi:cyclohexanone monooxygenase